MLHPAELTKETLMAFRDWAKSFLMTRIILGVLTIALLLGLILDGQIPFNRWFNQWFDNRFPGKRIVEGRVLSFLAHAGWKPEGEKVAVERVGENLGDIRPVLLYRSQNGLSTPGILFLVGPRYVLVGKLFDSETGRDLSPEVFGKVPALFDLKRVNMNRAHKRGSVKPKVTMVEYGDYGCEACAKLERALITLLDNYPEVQHVYKHFPLSEGSRYLAEVAEAAAEQGENYFWELHKRFFAADKTGWDREKTESFVNAQLIEIGLDMWKIKKALESREPRKKVSRDQGEFPVAQTPTLIINGEVSVGAISYSDLREIVEEKLKASSPGRAN